jgi:SAM-dependent methyltransferase
MENNTLKSERDCGLLDPGQPTRSDVTVEPRRPPTLAAVSSPPLGAQVQQMSPALDQLSLEFVIWSRTSERPCLDVGCGNGIASTAVLARGGHIVAVDPDSRALEELTGRTPTEQRPRLKVRLGHLPALDFEDAHFGAVHVARVLHLLDTYDLQQSLRKFFRWTYPAGKLFISTLTPGGRFWKPYEAEYARRMREEAQWPGYIAEMTRYFPNWDGDGAPIHLLDERVLRRELEAAGFTLEASSCYRLPWDSAQTCCAVIARSKA